MFQKIKAAAEDEKKKIEAFFLNKLHEDILGARKTIEALVLQGLEHFESVDEDLEADLEKFHADALALEAKIKAKMNPVLSVVQPGESVQAEGVEGDLPEGTRISGEEEVVNQG